MDLCKKKNRKVFNLNSNFNKFTLSLKKNKLDLMDFMFKLYVLY